MSAAGTDGPSYLKRGDLERVVEPKPVRHRSAWPLLAAQFPAATIPAGDCTAKLASRKMLEARMGQTGKFAIFTAIRRASSRVSSFAAERRPGSSSK